MRWLPKPDWSYITEMVQSEVEVRARFVVGADGAASHVRQVLGIETDTYPTATFVLPGARCGVAGAVLRVTMGRTCGVMGSPGLSR